MSEQVLREALESIGTTFEAIARRLEGVGFSAIDAKWVREKKHKVEAVLAASDPQHAVTFDALRELVANNMYHEWSCGGGMSYMGTQNTEDLACQHSPNCLKCKFEAALTASKPQMPTTTIVVSEGAPAAASPPPWAGLERAESAEPQQAEDGYDLCMRPGCGHYYCEHSFGEVRETTYVDPTLKEFHFKIGDKVSYPEGCMNDGCKCDKFWTVADLAAWSQHLSTARVNAAWDLSQVPGVTRVDSNVDIAVRITSYTENDEESARDVVYTEEQALYDKYPDVLFDFHVRWDKPPED